MNTLLWIVQLLMAGVFIFTGASKILAYEKLVKVVEARSNGRKVGISHGVAAVVGLLEIAGAACLIFPIDVLPPDVLVRAAAAALAFIMVIAGIYHLRREETAAPDVVLFLMAIFVIVGRWPN